MPYATTERQRDYFKEYQEKNKEKIAAYKKKWYQENKERISAQAKENYPRNKDRIRDKQLQRQYGITKGDYDRMLRAQGYKCKICHTENPGGTGAFSVDHCHDSGKVRGLLCTTCNRGMGVLGDNPETLRAAAKYLENAKETKDDRHK